jgi:soluble lytic murein transglycosylase-like protein
MKRETVYWLAYGALALVAFTGPSGGPNPPPSPPKGPGGPSPRVPPKTPPKGSGGGRGGDVISYFIDTTTGISVKTSEAPDVQWGAPEIRPEKIPAFQAMLRNWGQLVDDAGVEFRVPSKEIFAIMWSESGGDPNAKSPAGAEGLMQVMPFHFPAGTSEAQMREPRNNIRTGARVLASRRAGGSRDIIQVASLYNAGGNTDGSPFTNDQRPKLATRWGYAAEPGYIDSVAAAYNTAIRLGVAS